MIFRRYAPLSVFIAILCGPVATEAQRADLERVEQLIRLGRADEARGALLQWWNDGRDDASRRELQRGLWLRGRLTVDPVQAELDFQRLIVLYPRGEFTPNAIFRLAQSAFEMGDEEGARRHVATLVRDYPRSEVREQAEAWLGSAGPVPPPPEGVTVRSTEELQADTLPGDERRTPPAEDEQLEGPEEDVPPQVGSYFVQLGAFAEEARARALYDEVTAAGIDVRIVRVDGSQFLHVRFGRFVERADAVEALEELTESGINAALVRDERAEIPVGG